MPRSALTTPAHDPTPIFESFRGAYATQLLTAAVAEFDLFRVVSETSPTIQDLHRSVGLERRPAVVLTTALRAMGLLACDSDGRLSLTPMAAEHLLPGGEFDVSGYVSLAADDPAVREMIERLRTNRPANAEAEEGAAFIYRDGMESAMERESTARFFTMALAGRAKNVAPHLARVAPLADVRRLLDIGGGTGIYSIACLQRHPSLEACVLDRPEVLKVAHEMAVEYGVGNRIALIAGDMFVDPLPNNCQAILLSNVLHDWDEPACEALVRRCADALPPGGMLLIHDVFLNDELDGPLPIALYSAALFTLTEGRAYSQAEYVRWLDKAGLNVGEMLPTLIHCGLLVARKPVWKSVTFS
ncbi:MAG: methyltransferase domain-containing protein [Planctomycetales bacterium]|nr:methyltransferase domain-containing protein [Planctomycetales bacterium]